MGTYFFPAFLFHPCKSPAICASFPVGFREIHKVPVVLKLSHKYEVCERQCRDGHCIDVAVQSTVTKNEEQKQYLLPLVE